MITRSFTFHRKGSDAEARTVPCTIATTEPVDRGAYREVLDCRPSGVNLSRAPLPLIESHDASRVNVGVVEELVADGKRLHGVARFGASRRAEELFRDVLAGVVRNLSVGYQLLDEGVRLDESTLRFRWMPYEVSIVSVPADPKAGFYRSNSVQQIQEHDEQHQQHQSRSQRRSAHAAQEEERERVANILATARQFGIAQQIAEEYIRDGLSVREFQEYTLQQVAKRNASHVADTRDIGMTRDETERFSLLRAIDAAFTNDWRKAGFEREAIEATARRLGRSPRDGHSFFLPPEVLRRDLPQKAQRDLSAGTDNAGGYLVQTVNVGFIDALRAQTVVLQAGAQLIPGLIGDAAFPKLSTSATAYWLASEATDITESNPVFGQMVMTPRNVGAYVEISRQLSIQSSPAAEQLVMNDMAKQLAVAVDDAAIDGSGVSGEPTGILQTAGIGSVTGTSLGWSGLVEFETDVASANAIINPGSFAYVTTPGVRGTLKTREKATGTAKYCWEDSAAPGEGRVNGYRAFATSVMPAATMIAGDWSQLIIGEWGILELTVNPYANFKAGIIGLRAWWTVDVGVRHAAAFSAANTIT